MAKEIQLTQGQVTVVDDEDYEWLVNFNWHARRDDRVHGFYAGTKIKNSSGRWKSDSMHRMIMETPAGLVTDHIDRDTLNNQRHNLRTATPQQNAANRPETRANVTGLKGASLYKKCGTFRSQICVNGKVMHLGYFPTPELAHEAYKAAAIKYFGEFANAG